MFISFHFHWKHEVFIAVLVTVFSFFATLLLSTRNRLKVSSILLIYFSASGIFLKIIFVLIKCCFQIKMITLTWHFRLWYSSCKQKLKTGLQFVGKKPREIMEKVISRKSCNVNFLIDAHSQQLIP